MAAMATTVVVPLNDDSDPNNSPKKSKRARKPVQPRPPTPKPKNGRKRTLEDFGNDETSELGTPKRRRQQKTPRTGFSVQQLTGRGIEHVPQSSDFADPSFAPARGLGLELEHTEKVDENVEPVLQDSARSSQIKKPVRSRSPFSFKRQGQDVSMSSSKGPIFNTQQPRRKLLISDFAEPEYNSIIEGEDFTMISLSSVPSAQQHLSLRREASSAPTAMPNSVPATSNPKPRNRKPIVKSPTVTNQTEVFKRKYTGRKSTKLGDPDDTLQLTPAKAKQQQANSGVELHSGTYPSEEPKLKAVDGGDHAADHSDEWLVPADAQNDLPSLDDVALYLQPVSSSRPQRSDPVLAETGDTAFKESSHTIAPTRKLERYEESLPDDDQHENPSPGEAPLENEIRNDHTGQHLPNVPSAEEAYGDQSGTDRSLRVIEPTQHSTAQPSKLVDLDQSSILRLPQKSRTPSKLFSSPVLPVIQSMSEEPARLPTKSTVATPKLTRVVKADKALQDVVEPYTKLKSPTKSKPDVRQSPRHHQENLFSGFSVASRRELRAGLRLGEELAKRQSSILDITMNSAPNPQLSSPQRSTGGSVTISPQTHNDQRQRTPQYPKLPTQSKAQLPSPETSSNDTEQRPAFGTTPRKNLQNNQTASPINAAKSMSAQRKTHAPQEIDVAHQIVPTNETHSDDLFNDYYQGAGFDSDNDINQDEGQDEGQDGGFDNEPGLFEETDVWQLEAREASPQAEPVSERLLQRSSQIQMNESHANQMASRSLQRLEVTTEANVQGGEQNQELLDFDEEDVAASSIVYTPAQQRNARESMDTASSPVTSPQRDGEDFGNFTNFTQDLLQAANRQPHSAVMSKVDKVEVKHRTPVSRVTHNRGHPFADVFTTRSFLETSAASVKSRKSPIRKQLSFRPTNRKESWLFDPARLRKPPSPFKPSLEPATPTLKSDVTSFPLAKPADISDIQEESVEEEEPQIDVARPAQPVLAEESEHEIEPMEDGDDNDTPQTPEVRFADSSPLSIFVAAAAKAEAQRRAQLEAEVLQARASLRKEQLSNAQTLKSTKALERAAQANIPRPRTKANARRKIPGSRPVSSDEPSRVNTAQSSFISNASTNTSFEEDDKSQTSWLSLLSNVATPLIASTKAISSFATTAFQRSQSQTFYPTSTRDTTDPAIFTKCLPFNSAHWTALHALYELGADQPGRFRLHANSHYEEYLDLEIDSHGWKRTLEEWEVAVAVQFLRLLDREGVDGDEQAMPIDMESVIKRVFSLWVGMVMRGQVDLTEGKAGAWDRRFVGRREEILRKQKQWLDAHP